MNNNKVEIEIFKGKAYSEMGYLVAAAMLRNPLHLAVFKSDNDKSMRMQTKMFTVLLKQPQCNIVIAKYDGQIVGIMNYYLPGQNMVSKTKMLALLPQLFNILGLRIFRVLKCKSNWTKHQPRLPHLHFGPLAVLPAAQGAGIGSALINYFCRIADSNQSASYLETDKASNVILYEKFGFEVIGSDTLFGVTNWFMWREPKL